MKSSGTVLHALRWCASCAVTLACWALWLVLGGTLAALAVVAYKHDVPVPEVLLRRLEREFASAQLAVQFGRADLDPTGRILLQNVRVRSIDFEDPLLTSRLVYLRLDFWSLLAGRAVPDEVQLEGAALLVPAPLSPSGSAEPLVRDLAAVARHHDQLWHLDHVSGRIGRLPVVATGEVTVPPHQPGRTPLRLEDIVARYLKLGRRFLPELNRLEAFDEPALALRFAFVPGEVSTVDLAITAQAVQRPFGVPVAAGPLSATASARFAPNRAVPLQIDLATRKLDYDGRVAAWSAQARLTARYDPAKETVVPGELSFSAATAAALGEIVAHPAFHTDLRDWPRAPIRLAAAAGGRLLACDGQVDSARQSARLRVEGIVAPALFSDVVGRRFPALAPHLALVDPVALRADVTVAPGWAFARAGLALETGRATAHGVALDAARGPLEFDGRTLLARDCELVTGDSRATGSVLLDLQSRDYRMLLAGCLRPPVIDAWVGAWWPDFWEHFAFPAAPPAADVDLAGRWGDGTRTTFFGRIQTDTIKVRGVGFDAVQLALRLRHRRVHVFDLAAHRAQTTQRIAGWFTRFGDEATNDLKSVEFDLTANLDPADYGRLLGYDLAPFLEPWRLPRPPQAQAAGRVDREGPATMPTVQFSAQSDGALHYYDFPLERLVVTGTAAGDALRLETIEAGFAGGTATGRATLRGGPADRQLTFDASLKGVDLARAIRDLESFAAARAAANGTPPAPATESRFIKRATGGKIEAAFTGEGRPGALVSFKGKGQAHITGAELAEVHLFGLLSQFLNGVGLGFTSLKLDQARADFQLEAARLHFNELRVTGRNAALDARGDYRLDTKTLDFTARLSPFEESRALLPKVIDLVTNPLATFLELKLAGSLGSPNWSFVLGPTNLLRALVGAEPASAPAPAASPPTTPAPSESTQTAPASLPPNPQPKK